MYDRTVLLGHITNDLDVKEGFISSDMSVDSVHRLQQSSSFLKKFQDDVLPDADERCLDKFLSCNETCRTIPIGPRGLFQDVILGEMQSVLYDCCFDGEAGPLPSISRIYEDMGLGPGANLGCPSYDFYTKVFNSPLTRTDDYLYRLYRLAIAEHPRRFSAELHRQRRLGHSIVAGSKLSFVPKTREISRTVCTEPVCNMLVQKWIGSHLERQLRWKFKIDLSIQPDCNRHLAKQGSIDGTYGTIDLSSASDSISIRLCELLFPPHFVDLLKRARSPLTVLPDGREVELHMISSMGNGFTFPLQTLIFAALVTSCYRVLGIKPQYTSTSPSNYAVFGDDIICLKEAYGLVVECLEMIGFTVNREKSFNDGLFRESCGGDYFRGHDVRGLYCKTLASESDVYSILNRLSRWSSRTGVMMYDTFEYLYKNRPNRKVLHVPYHDGDSEGLKVPLNLASGTYRDSNYQCTVYRALVAKPMTYYFPSSDADGGCGSGPLPPMFEFEQNGAILAFIGGYVRDGRITVRSDRKRTKIRRRFSSSWNYVPAVDLNSQDCDWQVVVGLYLTVVDGG